MVLAAACSHLPLPGAAISLARVQSLSAGEWSGTTSQGMPIAFTVSSDETVTAITIGYDFNECSGSSAYSDLNVPTAPQVTCIPGPCSGVVTSYRAFAYLNGSFGSGPVTQINGLFLPGNQARGQVTFTDYPSCGTAPPAEWTARKR
jgi:hypothetical protein